MRTVIGMKFGDKLYAVEKNGKKYRALKKTGKLRNRYNQSFGLLHFTHYRYGPKWWLDKELISELKLRKSAVKMFRSRMRLANGQAFVNGELIGNIEWMEVK